MNTPTAAAEVAVDTADFAKVRDFAAREGHDVDTALTAVCAAFVVHVTGCTVHEATSAVQAVRDARVTAVTDTAEFARMVQEDAARRA